MIERFNSIEHMEERIYAIANCIEQTLLARGCIVHRKKAVTTTSVYIKVDYGLGGSIRISDHRGKQHLKYRFNVEADNDSGGMYTYVSPYGERYFYSYTKLETLLGEIIAFREERISKYNKTSGYGRIMEKEKRRIDFTKGFWNGAYEVKLSNSNRIKVWLKRNGLEESMMDNIVQFTREHNDRLNAILDNNKDGWKGLPYKHLNLIMVRYKELLDEL